MDDNKNVSPEGSFVSCLVLNKNSADQGVLSRHCKIGDESSQSEEDNRYFQIASKARDRRWRCWVEAGGGWVKVSVGIEEALKGQGRSLKVRRRRSSFNKLGAGARL